MKRGDLMYAIFETGGKQYKAGVGDVIYIEKLPVPEEETVTFDKVLARFDGKILVVGAPYIDGASVSANVIKHGKDKKIYVMTYKSKKNVKRKIGHRQPHTKIEIKEITA